jgi:hypothetical protein
MILSEIRPNPHPIHADFKVVQYLRRSRHLRHILYGISCARSLTPFTFLLSVLQALREVVGRPKFSARGPTSLNSFDMYVATSDIHRKTLNKNERKLT